MNKELEQASIGGNLETVKRLHASGVNIHANKDMALSLASLNGHLPVVKYLVENGADIHAGDEQAFRYASDNGHLDVVSYLKNQLRKEKLEVLLAD